MRGAIIRAVAKQRDCAVRYSFAVEQQYRQEILNRMCEAE